MDSEEVVRTVDVVDDVRVICDECLSVPRSKHLETLGNGLAHLALECHDGVRIAALPMMLVRVKRHLQGVDRRPWNILRCELQMLTTVQIDELIQRAESDMSRSAEVLAELQKAVRDGV